MIEIKPLYTIAETAELLRISPPKVRYMVDRGYIDVERIGRQVYVTLSGLQARASIWESILLSRAYDPEPRP